jgi:hypothetical protein
MQAAADGGAPIPDASAGKQAVIDAVVAWVEAAISADRKARHGPQRGRAFLASLEGALAACAWSWQRRRVRWPHTGARPAARRPCAPASASTARALV